MNGPYIDTSALAKWYLNEPRSEDFNKFITRQETAVISRLVWVEFYCLLARRRRARDITGAVENRVISAFEADIRHGVLGVCPLDDRHALAACRLLQDLRRYRLRTLDALHIAIALEIGVPVLATADRIMSTAARQCGFEVENFY